MENKFDLEKAGNRRFVSPKGVTTEWNTGIACVEIKDKYLILSKNMMENLSLNENDTITVYFLDDGLYLANITDEENAKTEIKMNLSKFKTLGEYKGSVSTRNKKILNTARNKAVNAEGELMYPNGIYYFETLAPNTPFPIAKMTTVSNTLNMNETTQTNTTAQTELTEETEMATSQDLVL